MLAGRVRGALWISAALGGALLSACGGSDGGTNPLTTPNAVAIAGGNGQVGAPGHALTTPLSVKVTNASASPIKGAQVTFTVASGAATVSPTSATTDANGQAQTVVTLGSTPGTVVVNAAVTGTALVGTFVLTSGTASTNTACATGSPQAVAAGGVLPGVAGTGVCLSGGSAGADFALVAFYGNPDSSQIQTLNVVSTGATAIATPDVASAFSLAPPMGGAKPRTNALQSAFDLRLRTLARQMLSPKVPAARAWFSRRNAASFNAIPASVTLNQIITLNANANDLCSNAINIGARVVAIGSNSIIVADTTNPLPTFTDAEYASFAAKFDTLVFPTDVSNFGQPTDIDKNGKILIFFTKEVNKLTPRGSEGRVDGFFFERDLFPQTDTPDFVGCPTSNVGEMFYVVVPDTNAVFSDQRTKGDILGTTPSTLAHEFQHLINAGRRLYVNNAENFVEDVWLNEGLSHVAEELFYYRESGNTPRQNITASVIGGSQAQVDAFNNDQGQNFGRYETFIGKPSQTSVYAGNDNLETRGATWNLLRYLADHRGTSDANTWSSLVNTTLTGQANLASVFGSNYLTQIRDWATSVFADDVPGVTDTRFLEPSWNMRDIFPHLVNPSNGVALNRFPLQVFPLGDAAPVVTTVFAGGAAYIRFHVAANAQASIDWTAGALPVSPLMAFTVVRSR